MDLESETQRFSQMFKIILVGNSGTGKSCIMNRFTDDEYSPSYTCTIGVDFRVHYLHASEGENGDGNENYVKLQIWDTAGMESMRILTSSYYRRSDAVVLVFDVTNMGSFAHIPAWMEEVNKFAPPNVTVMIVGNKCDLPNRVISQEQAQQFADAHGFLYAETSAKSPQGNTVHAAFSSLVESLVSKSTKPKQQPQSLHSLSTGKKSCCS